MLVSAGTRRLMTPRVGAIAAIGAMLVFATQAWAQSACSSEPLAVQVLGSGGPHAGGTRASRAISSGAPAERSSWWTPEAARSSGLARPEPGCKSYPCWPSATSTLITSPTSRRCSGSASWLVSSR